MPDMRFAPPNPIRIADRSSGMNATSVRSYNERLVLSLLLQNQGISRMEIGKRTGLSAQTVSVLVRSLEREGLVANGKAQKGRMGPPTIPLSLNPEGAFAVGIGVGHRQADVVLVDFVGQIRFHTTLPNPQVNVAGNQTGLIETVRMAMQSVPERDRSRIIGIGLALPEDRDELALAPAGLPERYKSLGEEIEQALGIDVYVQNDITAAAAGESMFGAARSLDDYLFFYLGARIHHRLVLNHQIFKGEAEENSGIGLLELERRLQEAGSDAEFLWKREADWPDLGDLVDTWLGDCVTVIDAALRSASLFLPIRTVIVSSYAPNNVSERIAAELANSNAPIEARPGELSVSPKAMGAASLPFSSKFTVLQ